MTEEDILAVANFAASFGFKAGFAEAADAVKMLSTGANCHESRQIASAMHQCLIQFAEDAHAAFMEEGVKFKIIFNANGSPIIQ